MYQIGRVIGRSSLDAKLRKSVCELFILRRHRPVPGHHPKNRNVSFRRMLCTNSLELLNSYSGRMVLGYFPPTRLPHFDPKQKNLINTWDIIMIDYRYVNMDDCHLVSEYPINQQKRKLKKGEIITNPFNTNKLILNANEEITNTDFFLKYIFNECYKMKTIEKALWMDI